MSELSIETLAIVRATFGEIESRHATIMLGMWHHLLPDPNRDALCVEFESGGTAITLVQAFLQACHERQQARWPVLRAPPGLCQAHIVALDRAFGLALQDVLGSAGPPMVVNAWREMLRAFLRDLCPEPA